MYDVTTNFNEYQSGTYINFEACIVFKTQNCQS